MADFDPTQSYSWPAAQWAGTYSGPTDAATLDAATSFDTSGFVNPIAGTFGWSLDPAGQTLSLTYTPTRGAGAGDAGVDRIGRDRLGEVLAAGRRRTDVVRPVQLGRTAGRAKMAFDLSHSCRGHSVAGMCNSPRKSFAE